MYKFTIQGIFSIVFFFLLFLQNGCIGLAFVKSGFNKATTTGSLRVGMKKEEVRTLLGQPDRVAARQTRDDVREVWTYRQTGPDDYRQWLGLSILSFGCVSLFPVGASEYHHVVFSDGNLIGWDLPDPYAPDLIIEKRER